MAMGFLSSGVHGQVDALKSLVEPCSLPFFGSHLLILSLLLLLPYTILSAFFLLLLSWT